VETTLKAEDLDIMMGLLAPQPKEPAQLTGEERSPDAAQLAALIRAAREMFKRRSASGDTVATAINTICSKTWTDSTISTLAKRSAAQAASYKHPEPPFPEVEAVSDRLDFAAYLLYALAAEEFGAGNARHAAILLATLFNKAMDEAEALSGLAVCAASLGLFAEATRLAGECLKLPQKHPRAYCVAGLCELEAGNRKAAKSFLALAARLARTRPEFRKALQAAQRLLLILHFA
jgi:hypothetical protein